MKTGMKTGIKAGITLMAIQVAIMARSDMNAVFDGGWRVSVGAVYDVGVKANARVAPHSVYRSPFAAGLSKSAAAALASGTRSGTRTDFQNGGWIDTQDPAHPQGDDPNGTWNFSLPASSWNGDGTFSLGSANYSEVEVYRPGDAELGSTVNDESGMLGVSVELSRNLYHNADYGFGCDLAFAFVYCKHNGLLGVSRTWMDGASTCRSGSYAASMDISGDSGLVNKLNDDSFHHQMWRSDGAGGENFGGDSYSGPSAKISPTISLSDTGRVASDASYGRLWADGDYENMEMILLVRPYYDVFEWMRVNAMLGLVVSRQDLDFTLTMMHDGVVDYRSSRDFSQWDVYGVAGGGLMLYYKDFTLSVDILARFLHNDLDFEDGCVSGDIRRGDFMVRLAIGYEF